MYRQPWHRYTIGRASVRLQVLDPVTCFELEPELVERFGAATLMAIAAPEVITAKTLATVDTRATALDIARRAVEVGAELLAGLPDDPAWAVDVLDRILLDRLRVDGRTIETWAELGALGMGPGFRWRVAAIQLSQTYRPLWLRSPYAPARRKPPDYGVPAPSSPLAVQWAAALSAQGYTSDPETVLREWTPERLIEIVEAAAYAAAVHDRASDAAKAKP